MFSPVTIRDGYITCSSVSFPHSVCSVSVSWVSLLRPLLTAQLWCREVLNTFIQSPHQHAVQILLLRYHAVEPEDRVPVQLTVLLHR